jgi:hypothetical protein
MPFDCAAEAAADTAKGVRPPLPITTTTGAAILRSSRTLSLRYAPPLPSAEPWWLRALCRRLHSAVAPLGLALAALALAAIAPGEKSVGPCPPRPGQLPCATARRRQGARSSARPAPLPTAAPLAPCTASPVVCVVYMLGQLDRPVRVVSLWEAAAVARDARPSGCTCSAAPP